MSQEDYTVLNLEEKKVDPKDEIFLLTNSRFNFDILDLAEQTKDLQVVDESSAKNALSFAMQSRKLGQTLENSRKELVKPHVDYQRSINKIVKDFQAKLEEIEERMQAKLSSWMEEQASNPFTMIDELKVEDGAITQKKSWVFEVTDPTLVPKEFLVVEPKLIAEAVKNGVRNISGVKIFEETKTSMRIKN